jgi:hypothetical protein
MFRTVLVALTAMACVCGASTAAAAQDLAAPSASTVRTAAEPGAGCGSLPCVMPAIRGAVLPSLYVGQIGLQVFDGYSTTRGLGNGAIESNLIMGGLARHPAALWAVKGSAAFASIYVAERLWRQHRRAEAIVVMVASNGIMAAVAARNASIIRAQR